MIDPVGMKDVNSCSPRRATGFSPAPTSGRTRSLPTATTRGSRPRSDGRKRKPRRYAIASMNTAWARAPATYAQATAEIPAESPRIKAAARPFMTTFIAAGATKEYLEFRYARRISATATSGTTRNMTRASDAARRTLAGERPGAVTRMSGHAMRPISAANATPPTTVRVIKVETRRWVAARPSRSSEVEIAGTRA